MDRHARRLRPRDRGIEGCDTMSVRQLTTKQLARRWGMRPRTVTRWCREGKIKAEKWGRVWRVPMAEVLRMEEEHAAK